MSLTDNPVPEPMGQLLLAGVSACLYALGSVTIVSSANVAGNLITGLSLMAVGGAMQLLAVARAHGRLGGGQR